MSPRAIMAVRESRPRLEIGLMCTILRALHGRKVPDDPEGCDRTGSGLVNAELCVVGREGGKHDFFHLKEAGTKCYNF